MADPKDREKEARIAELAKAIFVAHSTALAGDVDWAFRMAEKFDDLAQTRWQEACK